MLKRDSSARGWAEKKEPRRLAICEAARFEISAGSID